MTTRRDFCKNLCAASLMPAMLASFAKFYCGMDFGKRDGWAESCFLFFQGGLRKMANTRFSPEINPVWLRELRQLREEEYAGGRASPKSLSAPKPRVKSKREKLEEEYKMIWFEEASEFENWNWKGKKDA